ncbi:MAG: ATP-binding protein [Streptosporangiaceae bacterium]
MADHAETSAGWHATTGPGGQAPDQPASGHRPAWLASLAARLRPAQPGGRPLRRPLDGRLLGGVAAGIAQRTGLDVGLVRAVLVVAALVTSGFFAAAYVVAWLLIPAQGADTNIATRALADKRGIALAAALASVLVVAEIIASALGAGWIAGLAFPLIVCAAGLVLIARNADADERQQLREFADTAGRASSDRRSGRLLRVAVAVLLLLGGAAALLVGHATNVALLRPLGGIVLLIGGMALAFGPWWLRIARDLVEERQARIRAEERADIAARVHDSVLQTLALIQRRADDPHHVIQLARAQERELRAWLFDGRAPGSLDGQAVTVADAVRLIQQDVEAQHGMAVEAVTVGDCALDDELTALLAAAKEATVNAAKWSGADVVSLFAEVEPDSVSLYVRDRGRGFDPDVVPADRKGLAESVRARVTRRGGTATIRSAAGEGTEVSLVMPRVAADSSARRS